MNMCKDCLYWNKLPNQQIEFGQCRFNPPTLLMQRKAVNAFGKIAEGAEKVVGVTEIANPFWVVTAPDEWCGQWKTLDIAPFLMQR